MHPNIPYKCLKCRDMNWLIECACYKKDIIFLRDKAKRFMRYASGHNSQGSNHPNWKGGEMHCKDYVYIWSPSHPHKVKDGYVKRSRLTMEKHIGRHLNKNEVVHHIDGNTLNDKIKNLKLYSNNIQHLVENHIRIDMSDRRCSICGTNKGYKTKKGYYVWIKNREKPGNFICPRCYSLKRYHEKNH